MTEVSTSAVAPTRRLLFARTSWSALFVAMLAVGCDSNPTPHPGDPDVYPDTFEPNDDRDPESPNGADAVEVHTPDATDPTHGFEDDHCDTTDTTDTDTTDTTDANTADTTDAPDTGPTDTTDTSGPCDPHSRSPAAGESDSDFSAANPPPTGPR